MFPGAGPWCQDCHVPAHRTWQVAWVMLRSVRIDHTGCQDSRSPRFPGRAQGVDVSPELRRLGLRRVGQALVPPFSTRRSLFQDLAWPQILHRRSSVSVDHLGGVFSCYCWLNLQTGCCGYGGQTVYLRSGDSTVSILLPSPLLPKPHRPMQPQKLPGWNLPQVAGIDCDHKLSYFLITFVGFCFDLCIN